MIKELVAKIGLDNSGFVSTMKDTLGMVEDGKKKFNELTTGLKGAQGGFMAGANASKIFKVALASTGIGAIVVVLGSLVAYLTSTQEGMDKLRRVTEPVKQIFERLLGVLQNLGGNVFKGIAQMLNGDLKEGFKTLSEGAKQAGRETVNAFKDGAKAGKELADLNVELQKAQLNLAKQEGDIRREKAKQAEIARDQSKSEAERQEASRKVIELINRETKLKQAVLDIQIKDMKLRQQANDTDTKGKLELLALENERKELDASASMERIRFNNIIGKQAKEQVKDAKELINLQRQQLQMFLGATKGVGKKDRDPFSLENADKFSKQTLDNVKKITNTLISGKAQGGVVYSEEDKQRANQAIQDFKALGQEIQMTQFFVSGLGNVFSNFFEDLLTSGKLSFKGLIDGLKQMIAKLLSAVAAAFALNALLGGIGLGKTSIGSAFGGGMKSAGFKDIFSMITGMPRFAKGGMVTGLTTAVLGDNPSGKEAVIPFERMGQFLNQFGGGSGQGVQRVEVYGRLQGQDIVLASNNYNQSINKRYGF